MANSEITAVVQCPFWLHYCLEKHAIFSELLVKERNPQARENGIFWKMFLISPARPMLTEFK